MSTEAFHAAFGEFLKVLNESTVSHPYRKNALSRLKHDMYEILHEVKELSERERAKPRRVPPPTDLELLVASKLIEHGDPRSLFLRYDERGDKTVDALELRRALNSLGVRLSRSEAEGIVAKYDTTNHSYLDYEDFVHMLDSIVGAHRVSTSDAAYSSTLRGREAVDSSSLPMVMESAEAIGRAHQIQIQDKILGLFASPTEAFLSLKSGGEFLSLPDLRRALIRHGLSVNMTDLQNACFPFIRNKSRGFHENEFAKFLADSTPAAPPRAPEGPKDFDMKPSESLAEIADILRARGETLKQIFIRLDRDNSGAIETRELYIALHEVGFNLSGNSCKALINDFDRNGNGKLNYHELVRMLQKGAASPRTKRQPPRSVTVEPPRPPSHVSRRTGRLPPSTPVRVGVAGRDLFKASVGGSPEFAGTGGGGGGGGGGAPDSGRRFERIDEVPTYTSRSAEPPAKPVPIPSAELLAKVNSAVYSSGMSANNLFKRMKNTQPRGITAHELSVGLRRCGLDISPEAAVGLITTFDTSGDGIMSLSEFIRMLSTSS